MSSYCDINVLEKDGANHPYFTERLKRWTSGANGMNGCVPLTNNDAKNVSNTACLTDSEVACYSSYTLGKARSTLDNALVDVHNPQGSTSATFDSNYQTTMLTGLVWAALGTTVLYYAFTKI
jgi:hypothetical protein